MKKHSKYNKMLTVVCVAVTIMMIQNIIFMVLVIQDRISINLQIDKSVNKTISGIDIPKTISNDVKKEIGDLKIGVIIDESVNKKVDSLNLKNGTNGEKGDKGDTGAAGINSVSTNTIEKKVVTNEVIKEVPVNGADGKDGLSPIPVCNSAKNRWEYTYDQLTFFITLDRNDKQVKCIGG